MDKVLLDQHELESLLSKNERLEDQIARLEAQLMVIPLSDDRPNFDPRLAVRVSRPAWLAFVLFQAFTRPDQDMEFQQALMVGTKDPVKIRMTTDETTYLSRQMLSCFGRFGVVVRVEVEELSTEAIEFDGVNRVGISYHPIPGLPLAVEEAVGLALDTTTAWGNQQAITWGVMGPHHCLRVACDEYQVGPSSLSNPACVPDYSSGSATMVIPPAPPHRSRYRPVPHPPQGLLPLPPNPFETRHPPHGPPAVGPIYFPWWMRPH